MRERNVPETELKGLVFNVWNGRALLYFKFALPYCCVHIFSHGDITADIYMASFLDEEIVEGIRLLSGYVLNVGLCNDNGEAT